MKWGSGERRSEVKLDTFEQVKGKGRRKHGRRCKMQRKRKERVKEIEEKHKTRRTHQQQQQQSFQVSFAQFQQNRARAAKRCD